MFRTPGKFAYAALLMTLSGCAQNVANQVQPGTSGTDTAAPTITASAPIIMPQQNSILPVVSPDSMRPDVNIPTDTLELVKLDLYQITVPQGAVSESDAFWKHIEEPVVDVATNDLLYSNGIRAGEGSIKDWPYFKTILDKAGAHPDHTSLMAHDAQSQELFATAPMQEQRLFYFDQHGLSGKVYDDCRDLFMLSYEPAPRNPDCVRVTLSPEVQSLQYHYSYTVMNSEESVQFRQDQHLYDLNLTIDLPAGKFLVVAPSPDAREPDGIGAHFLNVDTAAVRMERVLILVANQPDTLHAVSPVTQPAQ